MYRDDLLKMNRDVLKTFGFYASRSECPEDENPLVVYNERDLVLTPAMFFYKNCKTKDWADSLIARYEQYLKFSKMWDEQTKEL